MLTTAFNTTFKGHDYAELAERFGVDVSESTAPLAEKLHEIHAASDGNAVAMCRAFVVALASQAREHSYAAPLWYGLAAIADDETFINYLISLLPHAGD